jgi:hypothetical protein
MTDERLAEELVEAVGAIATSPNAATVDEICAYVATDLTYDIARADVSSSLEKLARDGRVDAVDAAPGPDGLPIQGYRLPPRP